MTEIFSLRKRADQVVDKATLAIEAALDHQDQRLEVWDQKNPRNQARLAQIKALALMETIDMVVEFYFLGAKQPQLAVN